MPSLSIYCLTGISLTLDIGCLLTAACPDLGHGVSPLGLSAPTPCSHIVHAKCIPAATAKLLQSCPTLCSPIDGCPPGYPVPGILQARTHCLLQCRKVKSESEVSQSCPTLCYPVEYSPPGSSVHGIFQARIMEWVAVSFSRGSSQPRDQTQLSRIARRCFNI